MCVHTCIYTYAREAEAGRSLVQSQPQQKQGAKQLSDTLSLNKIQNRAGDAAQWLSASEFNPSTLPKKKTQTKMSNSYKDIINPIKLKNE